MQATLLVKDNTTGEKFLINIHAIKKTIDAIEKIIEANGYTSLDKETDFDTKKGE